MVNSTAVGRRRRRAPAQLDALLARGRPRRPLGGGPSRAGVLQDHETDSQHASRARRGRWGARGRDHDVYESSLAPNAAWLERRVRAGDVVVLHDPQTAGLAPALKAMGATVVFRSHVGADNPNALVQAAWDFLLPYISYADAIVFTRHSGAPSWVDAARVAVIPPCIDPCAIKNRAMDARAARAILGAPGSRKSSSSIRSSCTSHAGIA